MYDKVFTTLTEDEQISLNYGFLPSLTLKDLCNPAIELEKSCLHRQSIKLPLQRSLPLYAINQFSPCATTFFFFSSDSLLTHVEQLLRAFILKISVCDAVLDNNPPGCTFTILVHTREAATRNMEKIQVIKDFPWILADEQDVHMHDPRLIPLKTMTSDLLKMQLYVEERTQKGT
ncbi:mitotic spindle assembly checkpoint protein MAD2B [Pantherophis guttatus]|uniref:Mitotic spindle assembly checkpoint protein MAD2B n=1 Tax=Pantherophis guttatus TaxID=94885 RepID=A0ABM3YYS0_PANGU|nr:mitotic spindle assembly checkpoint protein MAD2B [Pantherophis guttatus]